jgi:hypothetical protein
LHPCKKVSKFVQFSSGANIKCISYLNKPKASDSSSTPCPSFTRQLQTLNAIKFYEISLEIELELHLLFGSSNSRNSLPFSVHFVSASKSGKNTSQGMKPIGEACLVDRPFRRLK